MLDATVGRTVRMERRVAAVGSRWRRRGVKEGGVLRWRVEQDGEGERSAGEVFSWAAGQRCC